MLKTKRENLTRVIKGTLVALAALALVGSSLQPLVSVGQAQNLLRNEPFFDFNDDFYRKFGLAPANIIARVGTPGVRLPDWADDTSGSDPSRRPVRIRQITGGWDRDGNLIYYVVPGFLNENSFARNADGSLTEAGQQARDFAEDFRAFLFPKQLNPDGTFNLNPALSVALPNRRQDNVFETKDRYFCENVLGLWLVTFVVFTQRGIDAWLNPRHRDHATLKAIANRNGTNLDGTPLIQRQNEIDTLVSKGLTVLRSNPAVFEGGGPPFPRWVI